MSVYAMRYILDQDIRPPGKKLTALIAANFVGPDGCACPGHKTLARLSGQSTRSVERHLDELFKERIFERLSRPQGLGRNTPSWFRLNAPPERLRAPRALVPSRPLSKQRELDAMTVGSLTSEPTKSTVTHTDEPTKAVVHDDKRGRVSRQLICASIEESDSESVSESKVDHALIAEDVSGDACVIWEGIRSRAQRVFGPDKFKSWIAGLQLVAADEVSLTLATYSTFQRDHVQTHFGDELAKIAGLQVKLVALSANNAAYGGRERRSSAQNLQRANLPSKTSCQKS